MTIKLTEEIPARTCVVTIGSIRRDFLPYNKGFRGVRPKKNKCWWCKHQFEDGDMMHLAFEVEVDGKRIENKLLCTKCANEAEEADDARQD